jgi:hypothetical protein
VYEIKIPENSSSNCYDAVVYSFLKYRGFDYAAYNVKYFYTDYYAPFCDIPRRIIRSYNQAGVLKDIFDVDLFFKNKDETKNLFDETNLSGIIIDPYYCHWSPFYQKAHYSHMLLIVDADYNSRKYVCFDVHFNSLGYIEADFDVINENYKYRFAFDFKEPKEPNPEEMIEKIKVLLNDHENNIEKKKRELLEYFTANSRESLFSANIETSVMLVNLMWIAEDKKNFPIALKHIESKTKKSLFAPIYDLLAVSEQYFLRLRFMLLKYAMSGNLVEDKLESVISKIYETDEIIVEQMKKAIGVTA